MFQKILVASDGSPFAEKAAEKAAYLASVAENAEVEILHVIDDDHAKGNAIYKQSKKEHESLRHKRLQKTKEKLEEKEIKYGLTLLYGDAAPKIVEYAKEHDFDVIVMGSRGLNVVQKMLLGSVSHKVSKYSHCPVIIVK
ncbi:universal stress protein [Massilibacterium senegalense]|uniref:universal stress protein n=1 Tax=Massilibacterium senegalense TaxID=1632858 RepID=UPI00078172B6|nr:universal stress protein [Massilibacterium senegalense]